MIQIRTGYSLRNVLDMYVIMGTGREAYSPNRIMSLNETGAFLWKLLEAGTEKSALVEQMTREYDVSVETASRDVDIFLGQLQDKNLITES